MIRNMVHKFIFPKHDAMIIQAYMELINRALILKDISVKSLTI
jgi:hypothetical protein